MTASPNAAPRTGRGLILALVVLAIVGAIGWTVISIGNPFPPRTILMATGPEGSAYHEFGDRYREIMRRSGFDVRPLPTRGGVENLARLRDPASKVSVGFAQGGLTGHEASPDLASLGAVSIEPLWIFLRGSSQGTPAQKFAGKRLSIGAEGSATRVMVRQLLALNGIEESSLELLGLPPDESAELLLQGRIDGAAMLTSWQSPAVRKLLAADGIVLEGYPRADAYLALFPTLSKVVLPMGVADLARNIPPTDVTLLAVEASLAVRRDLHPAVQYMLLEAASEIHGGPEIFHRAGRFPAAESIDLPLSQQAREFYKSGLPFVYRYLPLWLAGVAERLFILLIPLFTVVFPLVHFVPTLIAMVVERRMFSLYGELKFLESEIQKSGPGELREDVASRLASLAKRAQSLRVPLGYAQRLFILKSHIAQAQDEIEKRRDEPARG